MSFRRSVLKTGLALIGAATATLLLAGASFAQQTKLSFLAAEYSAKSLPF